METPYSNFDAKDSLLTSSRFAVRKLYEMNIERLSRVVGIFSAFMASYCCFAFIGVLMFSEARLLGWLVDLTALLAGVGIGVTGFLTQPREDSIRLLVRQMAAFFAVYLSLLLLFSFAYWHDDDTSWGQSDPNIDVIPTLWLHFTATFALGVYGVSKVHKLHRCLAELESLKRASQHDVQFSYS